MTNHNPNVDLVNDNVYTKFGLIQSIRSIERKLNHTGMTERERERITERMTDRLNPKQGYKYLKTASYMQ